MLEWWHIVLLALVGTIVDFRICHDNMNVPWNGFGSLESVFYGTAQNPMQGRPLFAWLMGWIKNEQWRVGIYVWMKCVGFFLSMYLVNALVGAFLAMVFYVALLACTQFDYIDTTYESAAMAGSIMAFMNQHPLALIGIAFLWSLMRETAWSMPVLAMGFGWIVFALLLAAVVAVGRWIPVLVYGKKESYVGDLRKLFGINLRELREWISLPGLLPLEACGVSVMVVIGLLVAFLVGVGTVFPAYWMSIAFILSGFLVFGKWNETRVLVPAVVPALCICEAIWK